jgi:hypothetical protein
MIEELERSSEIRGQAAALGFNARGDEFDGPISFETFTVNCKKATVREILNEIVRVSGKGIWFYREDRRHGKKYFRLGVLYS